MKNRIIRNVVIGSMPLIIVVIVLLVIFFRKPLSPKNDDAIINYHIRYQAEAGGYIEGKENQKIEKDKDGLEVKAVPNVGYYFTGWSDGVTTPTRLESNVQESKTFYASFALIDDGVTVTYSANELGLINGKLENEVQVVQRGTEGWKVTAAPKDKDEMIFVKWSDGITTPDRQDKDIMESFEVTAIFGYPVTYHAGEHGRIEGETEQVVTTHGSQTTEVTAVPYKGYTFIEWSDGVTSATRKDVIIERKDLIAYFEWVDDYDFSFHYNYATSNCSEASVRLKRGENSGSSIKIPVREHFNFCGWYFDNEFQEQATDEYGKILVEEVYNQPSRDLYAKWEVKEEDIVTYKVLLVFVTAIDAELKGNDGTMVQLHYRMSEEERKSCEKITREFEKEINDLLDGLVHFKVDSYFTTRTLTEENIDRTHYGVIDGVEKFDYGIWADDTYEGDRNKGIPELQESGILESYRSVLTTFSLNNDKRLMSFTTGGLSSRKYATIWYDKLLEDGNQLNGWKGNDRVWTYIHEFIHTIEMWFPSYKFDNVHTETRNELSLYESTKLYALNLCPIKTETDVEYVGIPYSAWKDDFCVVTLKKESINGMNPLRTMGSIRYFNLVNPDGWSGNTIPFGLQIPRGSRTTYLTAEADHGYRFIGWSDGCKNELHDPITNVQEDMTLIAYFERLSYTAEYRAMEGGRIEGSLIQTELTGNMYERVYAIADDGYRFVGWSDGVAYSNRIDEAGVIYYNSISGQYEGREDFIVYAIFEKI